MDGSAKVSFDWGDGEHAFRLPIGGLRGLQTKCEAGPAQIHARLVDGSWRVDDIRETILLGLIGGGMTPTDALVLVRRFVDERPLVENVLPATVILGAALTGAASDMVGERAAGKTSTKAKRASSSRRSTAPAR